MITFRTRMRALVAGLLLGWAVAIVLFLSRRRWLAWIFRLSPAHHRVKVHRGLSIAVDKDVILAHDHYFPVAPEDQRYPTILIRTPYDRRLGFFYAQRFAERGYNVILQDVRGRFGSTGLFEPFLHEQQDGLRTIEWLERQPWFDGRLGMWGSSYVGYVQWAVAVERPPVLKAIVPVVTTSRGIESAAPPGVIPFELLMRWILLVEAMESRGQTPQWRAVWRMLPPQRERLLQEVLTHLPLEEADAKLVGAAIPTYREAFAVPPPERFLRTDMRQAVADVEAPATFVGGWYDIFLQDLLADYETLRTAGKKPHLTIGPWQHMDRRLQLEGLRQGIAWFDGHLKGDRKRMRENPVALYVMGEDKWLGYDAWPPPAHKTHFYLHHGRQLSQEPPVSGPATDRYTYDPAQPTPSMGGPVFMSNAGPVDNRPLELRRDVLSYSTPELTEEVLVVGPVYVDLYVRSSLEHTDFFARLTDVHPDGRSMNLCDGMVRLEPGMGERQPDGTLYIHVNMWATANLFRRGHRMRLIIASGAHPRFDRNLGTGEPLGKGREMRVAQQTIFLDRDHPSALVLPLAAPQKQKSPGP